MNSEDPIIGSLCTQDKYIKRIFNLAHEKVLRMVSYQENES